MTEYKQMVKPNLKATAGPGWCLGYVSAVLGIDSSKYRSAKHAQMGTAFFHPPSDPLPDVPVLVWFDHFGRYDDRQGPYEGRPVGAPGNWGHVVYYLPGGGFYSSPTGLPGRPAGFEVFASIGDVERMFNAAYVGWSEDLAEVRFAEPTVATIRKDSHMHAFRQEGVPHSGIIIGNGQPPRARTDQVFAAEVWALGITPVEVPDYVYGTAVREAWADFGTSAEYVAKAVKGELGDMPGGGTAPLGVSDKDAEKIAQAVADEQAKRLAS